VNPALAISSEEGMASARSLEESLHARMSWHAPYVQIRSAEPERGDVAAVIALAKAAKSTVGFLPDSAFKERAHRGTLLVAASDDQIIGYLLHDLPRDEIKIVQLVVDPGHRGAGAARRLIQEVADRHPARRGIALSCRNDYPAHSLWPRLGFAPMGERTGKSLEGKPLTRWWKSFGHVDLLTLLDEADERPSALLDSCVFFEVVSDDPSVVSEQVRSDWLGDHVRIGISTEVHVEISKGTDQALRERQYRAAQAIPLLDPAESKWRPICEAICERQPAAGESDENDLRQVARAIAAEARWLVTTDTRLRARYRAVAEELGDMGIMSPAEFLRDVDKLARGETYRPIELAGTTVLVREVDANSVSGLAPRFVNHADGETITRLRDHVAALASQPRRHHVRLVEVNGEPRALVSLQAHDHGVLEVPVVRVIGGRAARVVSRHLLAMLRDEARQRDLGVIRVTDQFASRPVSETLGDEGFLATSSGAVAAAVKGMGPKSELAERLDHLPFTSAERRELGSVMDLADTPAGAALAELWFAPFRVLGAGLPTFVVPIKASWAAPLFDVGLADAQLFSREWELGLRRELAYYRSPRNGGGIAAPARILWYVTGAQREHGVRAIRAVSSLDEAVRRPVEQLWHRYRRLGVYSRADIEKAGTDGAAMALRFSNTELLQRPVGLDDYRKLVTGDPKSSSVVLQSPQMVDEHVFVKVVSQGRTRGG